MEQCTLKKLKNIKDMIFKTVDPGRIQVLKDETESLEWVKVKLADYVWVTITIRLKEMLVSYHLDYQTAVCVTNASEYIEKVLNMDVDKASFFQRKDLYNWLNTSHMIRTAMEYNKAEWISENCQKSDDETKEE